MSPVFHIEIDVARHIVRTRMAGFFDEDAIRAFLQARRLAFERLRCGPNQHLSLTDVREMAIQAQDIVSRWGAVLADPVYRSRRLGFVVGSTLTRTQLQRAIGSRDAKVFLDPAEAETWVLAAGPARRAA